jgi:Transposase DDE domain
LERQPVIEAALAKQHLSGGTLVLYDVSSYLEGRHCELAGYGHSRDNKPHKLQIIYGLLYAADGCPVAIEVFDGNTGDPTTLSAQIAKIKQRFALDHVILVGDRGMITAARIDRDLRPARLDWITALRAPQIRALVDGGALQPSLFDERDMAAITSPDYPSERLIVCRNPDLAAERGRKREDLLQATERDLAVAVARPKRPLRGTAAIARRVTIALERRHMAKHFAIDIADERFTFARNTAAITAEAALDGLYAVRTPVPADRLDDAGVVTAYKSLSRVEPAFRSLKTTDLEIRPLYPPPRTARARPRLSVHAGLLCRMAPAHLPGADTHERAAAHAQRPSAVAKAPRSPAARAKDASGQTPDGLRVHSLHSLFVDLATFTRNEVTTRAAPGRVMILYPQLTPLQHKAFDLLAVNPSRTQ